MKIVIDDLSSQVIADFLEEHVEEMKAVSPPESKHALDLEGLRQREITFWSVWEGESLVGCGALKELDSHHGEVKSMRVAPRFRKRGVATLLLEHIVMVARERGYTRLSLETGSMPFFLPARALYECFGFAYCEPFADYVEDPNSVFMSLA
ncbi:MAG: GNAT family N-acetyltransferase, partial [Bacteroidales bacterium]|nr:GNAT family N-acetyltransferase [Bacteroidales bacterium]